MLNTTIYNQWSQIFSYIQTLWWIASEQEGWQKDKILTAFVHKSYASDFVPALDHNERYEFLWDGILWWAIAFLLFESHPEWSEAQMTLYKIALVREEMLAQVAREIRLADHIFISHGEEGQWGRDKDVILADTLEALIGVWYEIQGFESVKSFISKYILIHLQELQETDCKSYKSLLQERTQKQGLPIPEYSTIEHIVEWFEAQVFITDVVFGRWIGKNKKKAHEQAAKDAYHKIV